jgi:hypothetical protein
MRNLGGPGGQNVRFGAGAGAAAGSFPGFHKETPRIGAGPGVLLAEPRLHGQPVASALLRLNKRSARA